MASIGRQLERHGIAPEKAMAGVLALLVEEREARTAGNKDATKIEVLLARVGLSNEDIAAATGKNANAVRVTLQRAKVR